MTWDLQPEEREAVLKLPAPERYAYFVKRSGDWEEVWSLRDDRGWVTADRDGQALMPVWPHPEYAGASAVDSWEGARPELIDLTEWLTVWLPELAKHGQQVAVFPVPSGAGVVAEPDRVRRDLEAEVELYE
jgi:hypothetical protein